MATAIRERHEAASDRNGHHEHKNAYETASNSFEDNFYCVLDLRRGIGQHCLNIPVSA